mgnify:CR=1 FL=1
MAPELFFPFCFFHSDENNMAFFGSASYSSFSIMAELSYASVVSGLCRLESTCSDFFLMWSCVLDGSLHLWAQSAETASPLNYRFCVVAYKLELVKLWLSFSDLPTMHCSDCWSWDSTFLPLLHPHHCSSMQVLRMSEFMFYVLRKCLSLSFVVNVSIFVFFWADSSGVFLGEFRET